MDSPPEPFAYATTLRPGPIASKPRSADWCFWHHVLSSSWSTTIIRRFNPLLVLPINLSGAGQRSCMLPASPDPEQGTCPSNSPRPAPLEASPGGA